jgi:hypothetical protein
MTNQWNDESDDRGCNPMILVPSHDRNRKRHNQRESMRINNTYEKKQDQHDMIVVNGAPTLKRRG